MSAEKAPVLVLVPGLGADARLFEPQRHAFPDLITPEWLVPRKAESLVEYAGRLAESVQERVPRGHPLVLGGVSFGGMLAVEMARHLRPSTVVQIASALSPKEIFPALRTAAMAGRFLPASIGERSHSLAKVFIRQLGPMKTQDRKFLESMIDAVPFSFVQWAGRAIVEWPGARPDCRLFRIHGDMDKVIPLQQQEIDLVISRGGHVPNVSHADEINAALSRVLGEVGRN